MRRFNEKDDFTSLDISYTCCCTTRVYTPLSALLKELKVSKGNAVDAPQWCCYPLAYARRSSQCSDMQTGSGTDFSRKREFAWSGDKGIFVLDPVQRGVVQGFARIKSRNMQVAVHNTSRESLSMQTR